VKYILISCIKLVFLFIIIWCTETQNWNKITVCEQESVWEKLCYVNKYNIQFRL